MSLIKKLAGETAIYGLSSIVGRMMNYLLVFVYTRTLTEAENGILNELYAYAGFLIVVYSYRMESAYFRYGTPEKDREKVYTTGLLSLDSRFRTPGDAKPGVAMRGQRWPHGYAGTAVPHGTVFSR